MSDELKIYICLVTFVLIITCFGFHIMDKDNIRKYNLNMLDKQIELAKITNR